MFARPPKLNLLDTYVTAVIAVGMVCAAALVHDGWGDMHRLLSPEALMFFLFAFCGEFVTLKVITRGAEGEVTTSTTFALAAMLVAGPLAGLVALGVATLLIALIGDLPDAHSSGLVGSSASGYVQATSTPSAGLYMETLGAIILIVAGGIGLLMSPPSAARSQS
jgi:hypothetical protein